MFGFCILIGLKQICINLLGKLVDSLERECEKEVPFCQFYPSIFPSGLPAASVVALCRGLLKMLLRMIISSCSLLLVFTGSVHDGLFYCL